MTFAKKIIPVLACVLLGGLTSLAHAQSNAGIAAVVNDNVITNSDVKARVDLAIHGSKIQPDAAVRQQMERQALQALIEEQIRMSEAKRLNIDIDDKEIEEGIDKIATQNNIPPETFRKILDQRPGIAKSLRDQIRVQVAWGKLVRQKLRQQVTVTDNDIDVYLAEQAKQTGKTEYEIAEILLPFQDDASEAGALKLAQQMVADLHAKKQRFSVLAKQFSQGAEASKGGLLGWVTEGRLDPALDSALTNLPIGQATDPIKANGAYHILFMKDRRKIMSLAESSQKLQIKQVFTPAPPQAPPQYVEQSFKQIKEWQAQATDCMAMQKIITANPSPMSRDLGMVALAELPPPVAAVVKDAETGKALEPLRASDGFLLLMVCGREDNSANPEAVRDTAANIIGSERLNRLQRRYFRDLKDAAYIDIKAK